MGGHNNQPIVGVSSLRDIGEEMRTGRNVWGVLSLRSVRQIERQEKNKKIKYIMALDGRQLIQHTQQSTKNTRAQLGRDRQDARPAGSTGGAQFDHFGDDRVARGGDKFLK